MARACDLQLLRALIWNRHQRFDADGATALHPTAMQRQCPRAAKRIIDGLQLVRKRSSLNRSQPIDRRAADSINLGEVLGSLSVS
jgi:hypothetical protein